MIINAKQMIINDKQMINNDKQMIINDKLKWTINFTITLSDFTRGSVLVVRLSWK